MPIPTTSLSDIKIDKVKVEALLWAKVDTSGGPYACWPWRGAPTKEGYGRFSAGVAPSLILRILAHRLAFWVAYDVLPPEVDHMCHNVDPDCLDVPGCKHRLCCNPLHLFAVTRQEHVKFGRSNAAKIACRKGHPFDGVNNRGQRTCSTCTKERAKRNHAKRRAAKGLPVYSKPGAPSAKNQLDPSTIR